MKTKAEIERVIQVYSGGDLGYHPAYISGILFALTWVLSPSEKKRKKAKGKKVMGHFKNCDNLTEE